MLSKKITEKGIKNCLSFLIRFLFRFIDYLNLLGLIYDSKRYRIKISIFFALLKNAIMHSVKICIESSYFADSAETNNKNNNA